MARVGFSTNQHTERFAGDGALQDPGPSTTWPNIEGGAFVTGTFWQRQERNLPDSSALPGVGVGHVSAPYGVNVAGSLVAREGYGMPFFEPVESADPVLPEKRVLLVDPRESRLPGVATLDLRAEKSFAVRRAASWPCRWTSSTCSTRPRCSADSTT